MRTVRDAALVTRCDGFSEVAGVALKPVTEREDQRVERLFLGRHGDIALDSQ